MSPKTKSLLQRRINHVPTIKVLSPDGDIFGIPADATFVPGAWPWSVR